MAFSSGSPVSLTRVLHSCILAASGREKILVDPCFGIFASRPLTSRIFGITMPPPALQPGEIAGLSLLALTHGHEDHFDAEGVARLPSRGTRVVVGQRRLARKLAGLGFRDTEVLRPWESAAGEGWRIQAVPARAPNAPGEISFVLTLGGLGIFHGGDTAAHTSFEEIRERCAPAVACLPVSGVSMLGVRLTMTPGQAAKAARSLGVRLAIPIHEEMAFGRLSRLLYRAPGTGARFEACLRRAAPGIRCLRPERGEPVRLDTAIPPPGMLEPGAPRL
ncbi:MAG TPA: MBL fold metallo-hydrolase [Candidatus Saccharimonadales bacterium]|nr:MBL fold metallo-hydrolase [Candidatus Saccharimonadales bacterium]